MRAFTTRNAEWFIEQIVFIVNVNMNEKNPSLSSVVFKLFLPWMLSSHDLLQLVNFELKLALPNFLPTFSLLCSKILKTSMSISRAMVVKLFNFQRFVCLSKNFSCLCKKTKCRSIVKLQKRKGEVYFFQFKRQSKFFSVACTARNSTL